MEESTNDLQLEVKKFCERVRDQDCQIKQKDVEILVNLLEGVTGRLGFSENRYSAMLIDVKCVKERLDEMEMMRHGQHQRAQNEMKDHAERLEKVEEYVENAGESCFETAEDMDIFTNEICKKLKQLNEGVKRVDGRVDLLSNVFEATILAANQESTPENVKEEEVQLLMASRRLYSLLQMTKSPRKMKRMCARNANSLNAVARLTVCRSLPTMRELPLMAISRMNREIG